MKKFRPTPMQEAMLFEAQNASGRYISRLRYVPDTPIDAETLSQRLTLLTRRHEILRTRFVHDGDGILWLETGENDAGHFRVSLTQADELTVEFNHVLLDGWSVGTLIRELMSAEEPASKASPFRYYVKWIERRDTAADLQWWKDYIGDADMCPELPNRTNATGYERRELRFALDNSELLRNTARELRITAGRLLQSVWCMLIARYNGGESLVCTVNSGRSVPVPGITEMVGMCVNTLPIVTRLPKPPESVPFADWVCQWNSKAIEAEKHGFCNLGDLIRGAMPHILSIDPPFDGEGYRLISSSAELVTDFDAAFTLCDEITAEFAYNACAYSDESAIAIRGHFLMALNAVLENPDIPIEQIPILTVAETSELTAPNINSEILEIIERQTVVNSWRESAKQHANREALVCGDVRLTYAELSDAVDKLSSALRANGVTAETPVAILLPRSEKYVIAELAVLSAGGLFIPLDSDWPDARIQTILTETKPKLVIDEKTYAALFTYHCPLSINNDPSPHNAAYMIMTSGTTGTPKGVVIEHRSLLNFCLWAKEHYMWQLGDACALQLNFAFDGSMWSIFPPLISGGTLHIPTDDIRFDLGALGEYCRAEHITHIDLPVTIAEVFREIYRGQNTLSDLRVMVTGGEEVRRVVPAPYPLSNEYGPTECTICCSAGWLSEDDEPITLGSPPPNMNVYILDTWGRLCPYGVTGEACFSGVQLARGYFNAPDLTAERFVSNQFADGNPDYGVLYRTGDLMRLNTRRELVFMGRMDNQVKLSGYRIELAEIENVLRAHSAVDTAIALVREKLLCAYVVPSGTLDKSELYELIELNLPSFMRPVITIVDRIPLTSSGKVDFEKLLLPQMDEKIDFAAPVTEKEKILVSVISRLLGIADIGIKHNYLELGGNSINAMRISFCLGKEGYALSAKELITSATLGSAATKMRLAGNVVHSAKGLTTFTPLAVQQAMMFLTETAGSDMYAVTVKLNAVGLCEDELKRRLDKAVELHDILRTTFETDEDGHIYGHVQNSGCQAVNCTLRDGELTIRYHHIALDGYSANMLIDELLFDKFPETASSFADFANQLAAQTERQLEDNEWWHENCHDAKIVKLLTTKTDEKPDFGRISFCSSELLAECTDAAKAAHVTPAAFMLTAWSVVVNTLGAEAGGILIPFTASCRDDDTLMGMCAQTLPLLFRQDSEDFAILAHSVQDSMLESVSHWFVPQDIIRKLPDYLFVFEDGDTEFTAHGEQNYDLVVKFSDRGELIYNAVRLPDDSAQRIAEFLESALKTAVRDRVSVLCDSEYELVTKSFASGRIMDVKIQTAARAFIAAAETYTDCPALETAGETHTYAELNKRACALADRLHIMGIGAGDIVAFLMPRTAEGVIAQLGIVLSGAAFLPLDPMCPEDRAADILLDSGAAAVIKDGLSIELTGAHGKVPDDTAYIIYTSGTTGRPKGVVVPEAALINQITWAIDEFGFTQTDKMLHYIAFTFDPSVWVLFTALCSGATLSLLPEEIRLDPNAVALYIEEHSITRCTLPAAVAPDILRRVKSSHLRSVYLGGEAVKNLSACNFEIINCYGPTEACINAAFYRLKPCETETRNIGRPVANTSCYILDARGEPCPVGIQGELYIGGVQLATGYLNRPNEGSFITHPRFGRIYKTGDSAAWNADGTIKFLGREDNQVKIRGNRVELSEIENVMCELSGVSDAKVLYRDGALDAYIIASKRTDISALKKRLPSYMLPRTVTVMDSFPLTENGKVDTKALPSPSIAVTESTEPLTDMESAVASAWKTALGLAPDFVIKHSDSFFDLGGHSLLLFHVTGILSAGGCKVDIKTLIEHPILADLAEAINQQETKHSPKPTESKAANADGYKCYVESMKSVDLSESRDFRNILITGSTGFLGSHLVREFYEHTNAVIHLPVRGDATKLKGVLEYYFGTLGTEMSASSRLRVYLSDISEMPPDVGAPLDAIFHTAADIRHYAPEQEMFRANVTATEHMLTLAKQNPDVLFAHISTTSAVNSPVIHETDTDLGSEFDNIYQRTKQLAERLVLDAGQRGLKYAVFRVGHVSPGFENGSVARNWEINAMLRLTGAMLLTELLPEQDYPIGYGYVDKTARAIWLLSTPVNLDGHVFHIDNPNTLRLSEIFMLAGLAGTVLPNAELITRLTRLSESRDAAVKLAASEYLGRLSQGSLEKDSADIVAGRIHMDATLLLLERLGFRWPHLTAGYIQNIIHSLRDKGGTSE